MLPVAFASSLWTATLRRIARTAVTALAVIAGLTGPAATPADHLDPAATTRPAVDLRVDAPAAADLDSAGQPVADAPLVRIAADPSVAPVVRTAADPPLRHPLAAPAPAGPPHRSTADTAAPVAGPDVVVAADPGRATIARRGPPRA
ncbi:hypothetical protein ABZV78_31055 [Micromonospora sp. NPDC004540]|uniref:hypothetical protein n=1 Tax=Micromonospora sp. NPDC004540 TaxID=3154457 RepID=UPI0033A5FC06